ncbi:hypothetical protein PoB_002136400 [Plakobranchus ocellatus]|uniref:Uncharacterized protein n=1 Tax=Plakobranchus ocellatus TaxID=259542 RepID=A0AAV3ZHR6_9GAST|nr:hypothetical protein PoB_002136400 [Plakobranchus ocellatus]
MGEYMERLEPTPRPKRSGFDLGLDLDIAVFWSPFGWALMAKRTSDVEPPTGSGRVCSQLRHSNAAVFQRECLPQDSVSGIRTREPQTENAPVARSFYFGVHLGPLNLGGKVQPSLVQAKDKT